MFVRYAYPPNALGYCGPDGFADYAAAGVVDQGLVKQAQAFSGAWPYLELIAASCGIADPLDHRVVEAYWVGNDLLDRVLIGQLGDSMAERFRKQVGNKFQFLAEGVLAGGVPHHSFHVFGVYPWVGLLSNDRMTKHALNVLDRCRVRWGKVTAVHGDQATVESRPLLWDGRLLTLGEPGRRDGPAGPGRHGAYRWYRPGRLGRAALGLDLRQAHRPPAPGAARLQPAPPGHGQPPRGAPGHRRRPGLRTVRRAGHTATTARRQVGSRSAGPSACSAPGSDVRREVYRRGRTPAP